MLNAVRQHQHCHFFRPSLVVDPARTAVQQFPDRYGSPRCPAAPKGQARTVIRSGIVTLLLAPLMLVVLFSGVVLANSCPWHCTTWYDGCNRCDCINGKVQNCDRAGCVTARQTPRCLVPAHASAYRSNSCKWYGTAPFCGGSCPLGQYQVLRSRRGDGKKCATGNKVYCCPTLRTTNQPAYCLEYAQRAINQYHRAVAKGCRVSGPVWHPGLDHHYNWCLTRASLSAAQTGDQSREVFLSNNCRN